jgi:hypothetical protein
MCMDVRHTQKPPGHKMGGPDHCVVLHCDDGRGTCACSEQLGLTLRGFVKDDGGPAIEVERLYYISKLP